MDGGNIYLFQALRPDMLQDGSCRFCRKLCKEVLAKLVEEQEVFAALVAIELFLLCLRLFEMR